MLAAIESGEARKKEILALYEEPGFFQRTSPAEVEKLEQESRELSTLIESWIEEWEALETELAELEASV